MPTPLPTRLQPDSPDFDAAAFWKMKRQQAEDQERNDFILSHGGMDAGRSPISGFISNLPKNITVGVIDAVVNTLGAANDALGAGEQNTKTKNREARMMDPKGFIGGDPNAGLKGTPQDRREASLSADAYGNPRPPAQPLPGSEGMVTPGNLDLYSRPRVKLSDGSTATVRSMGVNINGKEVLLPTISTDGRELTPDQAIAEYKRTGQHLGMFDSVENSNKYAQALHEQQAALLARDVVDPSSRVKNAVMQFRDELAQGGSTADELTQGVAQFALPFMGWAKALGGLRGASMLGTIARSATAEAATASTALDPHAGRVADIAAFGRTVEGKLGDALRAATPDGSLLNAYINYMTDRSDEGVAEGRFKNVVDSLGVSAATAGLFKLGAKTIKGSGALARALAKSPDAPTFDIVPGKNGFAVHINGEPTLSFNSVDEAEGVIKELGGTPPPRQGAAPKEGTPGVDTVDQQPIGNGRLSMQPSDNGFTVYAGKRPMLEFTNEKDAQDAIASFHQGYGQEAAMRIEANRASASDKHFATLHSFARVLQANADRPVSTHSLIDALERNLKGDTEEGAFYKELLGRLRDKKLAGTTTVTSKEGRGPDHFGYYSSATNSIELHPIAFSDPEDLVHTFGHEAVHAATMRELHESPQVYRRIEKIMHAVSRAHDERVAAHAVKQHEDIKQALEAARNVPKPYGFTDPFEFVAEIESNPAFRADMKKAVASDGETVWDKYLKAIAGILSLGALATNPEFEKMMDPQQENNAGA